MTSSRDVSLPWSPAGPSIRDHARDQLPLSVGQIGANTNLPVLMLAEKMAAAIG